MRCCSCQITGAKTTGSEGSRWRMERPLAELPKASHCTGIMDIELRKFCRMLPKQPMPGTMKVPGDGIRLISKVCADASCRVTMNGWTGMAMAELQAWTSLSWG